MDPYNTLLSVDENLFLVKDCTGCNCTVCKSSCILMRLCSLARVCNPSVEHVMLLGAAAISWSLLPPSLPLSLPGSLPQSVGDPSLPLPPLPTQGSHPNGASLASILRISHFRICSVAIDDKMLQTLWRCHLKSQPK